MRANYTEMVERLRRERAPLDAKRQRIVQRWTDHDMEALARGGTITTVAPDAVEAATRGIDREIRAIKSRIWTEAAPLAGVQAEGKAAAEALMAAAELMDRFRRSVRAYNSAAAVFNAPSLAVPFEDLDAVADFQARTWAARAQRALTPAKPRAQEREPLAEPNYANV